MKYRLFLDLESDEYLREWAAANKRYVVGCPPLASDFEVVFDKLDRALFLRHRKYGFHFSYKESGRIAAKGEIRQTPEGENDYGISFEFSEEVEKGENDIKISIAGMLRGYVGTFLNANAFLIYGNILGEKEYIAAGRNEGGTKVITFRKHKDTVYAVHTSARRSPEGVFSVRGHFRHYQDGKIIWIDEYMKGVEKE